MQEAREEKKEKGVWLNLPGDVMRKLDWLAHHFNTTRANVLRWAIVSLYEEERKEDIVQLQQAPDGWWVLRDGEEEILKLRDELLVSAGICEAASGGDTQGECLANGPAPFGQGEGRELGLEGVSSEGQVVSASLQRFNVAGHRLSRLMPPWAYVLSRTRSANLTPIFPLPLLEGDQLQKQLLISHLRPRGYSRYPCQVARPKALDDLPRAVPGREPRSLTVLRLKAEQSPGHAHYSRYEHGLVKGQPVAPHD